MKPPLHIIVALLCLTLSACADRSTGVAVGAGGHGGGVAVYSDPDPYGSPYGGLSLGLFGVAGGLSGGGVGIGFSPGFGSHRYERGSAVPAPAPPSAPAPAGVKGGETAVATPEQGGSAAPGSPLGQTGHIFTPPSFERVAPLPAQRAPLAP